MFSVLCLDLDGTLLTSDKRISVADKEAIKNLKTDNVQIVLVSGRHIWEITEYAKELELSENDYIVSCDGQYICDFNGETIWENGFLSKLDILHIGRSCGWRFSFFTNKKDYRFKHPVSLKYLIKKLKNKTKNNTSKKEEISLWEFLVKPIMNIEKAVIYGLKDISLFKERFFVKEYPDGRVEITHRSVDKYYAIKQMIDFGYIKDIESILYIGDDINDDQCFENLKYCVAMGNANEGLKSKAFFVTKACDESGVAFAIKKLKHQTQ